MLTLALGEGMLFARTLASGTTMDVKEKNEGSGTLTVTVYQYDGDNCLVLFYESFSSGYSYTALGSLDEPAGLAEAVGSGGVAVTFDLAG